MPQSVDFLVLFNRARVYLISSLGAQSCEQTSFLINICVYMCVYSLIIRQSAERPLRLSLCHN